MPVLRRAQTAPVLCGCGCGEATKVATKADSTYRKGEARRFLSGHQFRKDIGQRIKYWTKRNELTGCREWIGAISHGYGYVHYQGKPRGAHIVAYTLESGPPPNGMMVCHSCDNRKCCEITHLFLGTGQDNVDDCVAKGRQSKGSKNGHAKLSETAALAIRTRLAAGEKCTDLAAEFCISLSTVSMIGSGKTWRGI